MRLFLVTVLSVWTLLNVYVFFRLAGLPLIKARVPSWALWSVALVLLISFPGSRWLRSAGPSFSALAEIVATSWLGVLFLLFVCFLVVDLVTAFGLLFTTKLSLLRTVAVAAGLALSVVAFFQGLRPPVIREHVVELPGLPREHDGLRLAFVSDLHLGSQIREAWLKRLIVRLDALKPDVIAIGGDLVDHDVGRVQQMVPQLRGFRARLGVWAVLGNHEFYGGATESARLLTDAGIRVLRDESVAVLPGLRIAGVDDVGVRGRSRAAESSINRALQDVQRGREGVVYLSHTPEDMELAEKAGAGLMLSGHTHGGQIWPFNFLVGTRFKEIVGRYSHGPMTLLISRGAGTWGPRMRLWRPGEILLITLRSPAAGGTAGAPSGPGDGA